MEHASVVLMTFSFARQNVGASKRLTLDSVPVSLKSKSWNWPGRFATAAPFVKFINLLFARVEKKRSHLTLDGHSHWLWRREFLGVLGVAAGWPLATHAHQMGLGSHHSGS
jgi:hypothetical protein